MALVEDRDGPGFSFSYVLKMIVDFLCNLQIASVGRIVFSPYRPP